MDNEKKFYTIAGKRFYQQYPVLTLANWITKVGLEAKKAGYVIDGGTAEQYLEFIADYGTRLLAIVLIPAEWTPEQKVKAGFSAVLDLETFLGSSLTDETAAPIMRDFLDLRQSRLAILQVAPADAYEPARENNDTTQGERG